MTKFEAPQPQIGGKREIQTPSAPRPDPVGVVHGETGMAGPIVLQLCGKEENCRVQVMQQMVET